MRGGPSPAGHKRDHLVEQDGRCPRSAGTGRCHGNAALRFYLQSGHSGGVDLGSSSHQWLAGG